eukprot:SAG31_NODE_1150_length_9648_cov_37.362656_3_plen_112_part_00
MFFVVCVFDTDLWDAKFEKSLNFVDPEAGGRCLISTRVTSLLSGEDALQVQLPTESEAARILMDAAGSPTAGRADQHRQVPVECLEVVKICGRLPLALEMVFSARQVSCTS